MNRNLSLLSDFYEFTMGNSYFEAGMQDKIAIFDMYFREVPDHGSFALSGGLESIIEYIKELKFTEDDIAFFRNKNMFSEGFLEYLKNMEFTCDVWAVPDGSVVFPNEPLVTVKGLIIQASIIETMVLLCLNHQSLVTTKANRIVRAANGKPVMEFGSRRAQGADAATYGAKASYIAGCSGTANTLADKLYGVTALGTMAHSYVTMFDTEYEAFKAYAQTYPDNCTLLVDTYNTLKSGVPNAIKVFDNVLKPLGYRPKGIRIDSGDIAFLSKQARKMLDDAGYEDCSIVASNSLDEYKIQELWIQNAKIDSFGVGERLITAKSDPVFGGVYKLVALEKDGEIVPKIKISENVEKITTPGMKKTYRIFDKETNMALADLICLHDEKIDESKPLTIFHPTHTWKRKTIENFYVKNIQEKIFEEGKLVYDIPTIDESKNFCKESLDTLWDEYKRLDSPHLYKVDLSKELWTLKTTLINEVRNESEKNFIKSVQDNI